MKTIIRLILLNFSLAIAFSINAQSGTAATTLLSKVQSAYMQSSGIFVQFNIKISNAQKQDNHNIKGSGKLKKEAFFINVEDKRIWFDGKKQYTYEEGASEAYISEIEESNEIFLNPIIFLKNYNKAFNVSYTGKKQIGGKAVSIVQFTPKDKKNEITKMVVGFYDADSMMAFCEITNKDKQTTRIDISSYKNGQQFSLETFSFDAKRYPNVELIDLR